MDPLALVRKPPIWQLVDMIRLLIPVLLISAKVPAAPSCDDPSVRKALLSSWERMAKAKSDQLGDSHVKVWNLRQDGKAGECRADFLARKPGSSVGGSLPYAVKSGEKGRIVVEARGEPTLNLLQSDSANQPNRTVPKER